MVVMRLTFGFSRPRPRKSASCQLESSSTTGVVSFVSSRKLRGLTVMLPPRKALKPAAFSPWWMALTVEDLPLLPVTAMMGALVRARKMDRSVSMALAAVR